LAAGWLLDRGDLTELAGIVVESLLWRLAGVVRFEVRRGLEQELEPWEEAARCLSSSEFGVYLWLARHQPRRFTDIVQLTGRPRSSAARALRGLLGRGLVTRDASGWYRAPDPSEAWRKTQIGYAGPLVPFPDRGGPIGGV